VAHFVRDGGRLKRGGPGSCRGVDLERVAGADPGPEFVVEMAEECCRLLARLDDETLRSLVVWKMEGYTNEEIASKLGCVTRTIERKLRLIREIWENEA
jgi:DNA-directed RNA polymerase specialized sigma24 family protein